MWIADSNHIRRIDARATSEFGIPPEVLMENAGKAVFESVRGSIPVGSHVVVFCGKGNNGGDGVVVARLAHEGGYDVTCWVAAREDLSPLLNAQIQVALASGLSIQFGEPLPDLEETDFVVDALMGTGGSGEPRGLVRKAIAAINESDAPVVSIDVPSGIQTDSGEALGDAIYASRTVTFGLPKPFLFLGDGVEHSGSWTVVDIGYPEALLDEPTHAHLVSPYETGHLLPIRDRNSHKGANGSVLIVAGSEAMPGAATLACRSALRAGAGKVTLASLKSVCDAVTFHHPEVITLPMGSYGSEAAEVLLESQHRFDSVLFGPGMTTDDSVLQMLADIWKHWDLPSCIDADALNAVSLGISLPDCLCVLTPHPGEMGRLMSMSSNDVQANRFDVVNSCVSKFAKCVLLKGAHSIVGSPKNPLSVNWTGNAGMACAGMGDVLGGVIATLLGQGLTDHEAATSAMYWHGVAGDLCAAQIGSVGYLASEVADALPSARAKIRSTCDSA